MLGKKTKKKEKINFLLENPHYRRLHLYLYFISVLIIVGVYFIVITIFSDFSANFLITGIFSLMLGLYLVYNRDNIVKFISEKMEERRRKEMKRNDKHGLNSTLKKISPKNKNLKLKITGKTSIKEKIQNLQYKVKKDKKTEKEYIEIK